MANPGFQVTNFGFQGLGQFGFQTETGTPVITIDRDADPFRRDRERRERLHAQVAQAFSEAYAVTPSVQAAVAEIVQESREWFPEYRIAFDLPQYLDTVRMMAEHAARLAIEADDEEVLMILRDRNG